MGGIGKTTLALSVLNRFRDGEYFDLILWVSVSQSYDVCSITNTLLQSGVSSTSDNGANLNFLQIKLCEKLSGKRFLIVLDDVWNEKYGDWQIMKKPFNYGTQGSRIIVTTRSHEVARIMGTTAITTLYLNVLEQNASWELFSEHAFGNNLNMNPDLERIGGKILEKCNGLPLAAKTLGGLLRSKLEIDHWERILATEIWELSDKLSDILPSLSLSYNYLPLHLKRCFAYCAIFPKKYRFEKEELILLWMAQNLLEQPQGNKRIEEVGDQYFNDLVSMSLIEPSSGSSAQFVMHDLIVDLATFISGKYYSRQESLISDDVVRKNIVRHLACVDDCADFWEKLNSKFNPTKVRSFIVLSSPPARNVCHEAADTLILKLRYLRTLSFSGHSYNCREFIAPVCGLRHLRYLKLSDASVTSLPDSLCTLYNLQTLKLAGCHSLCKLPEDFQCLVSLRYLDACSTGIESLPESICELPNLQKLILHGCSKLTKLPGGLDRLVQLRYLDASLTELEILPVSISKLHNLQKLILHGCSKLTSLPCGFHQIVNLRYLDVSSTGIKQLPNTLRCVSNLEIRFEISCS